MTKKRSLLLVLGVVFILASLTTAAFATQENDAATQKEESVEQDETTGKEKEQPAVDESGHGNHNEEEVTLEKDLDGIDDGGAIVTKCDDEGDCETFISTDPEDVPGLEDEEVEDHAHEGFFVVCTGVDGVEECNEIVVTDPEDLEEALPIPEHEEAVDTEK